MTAVMLGALIVLACTVIEGIAQVFLKISVLRVNRRYGWIALGVAFYLVEIGLYTVALRLLAVSTAFAISSLSFVTVVVFAAWWLHERVTATRWLGIGLILGGVTLIVVYA
jgi:drug/metabolite transporter (DMT)-like permease